MKQLLFILIVLLVAISASAQSWRDSLEQGKAMFEEGKYNEAYESLVEAQKLAPEGVDLSKDIGNAAYRKGDYEMAEKAFRSAASSSTESEEASKQWHNVGNSQLKRKDYQAAVESYKEALRKDPSNENARYNLAEAKRRLKKQQEQQKKQNQNQKENQNQNQDQNQNNSGQDKQSQNQQDQQSQQGSQKQDQQNNNQQQQQGDNQQGEQGQLNRDKLSSKKTERMLDELLKKEMKTKRKAVGTKSGGSKEVESGKKW